MAVAAFNALKLALDPAEILRAQGIVPDPWQRDYLLCEDRRVMLNCCRGAGKSRATSAKALHHALFRPKSLVLLLSRSQRQSGELFRYVKDGYSAIGRPLKLVKETETQLEFANGSRVVCLPGKEETIRSYQGVTLLIKDEAARIPEDLNKSVTPMLAISQGQEIDLSMPFGQRGYFWRKWADRENDVTRFLIPWQKCPRHTAEFIARETREHGESWVKQEYECSFEALSGLVFPDFDRCGVDVNPTIRGPVKKVGGIDWGYRDPFVALWGRLDVANDVLWIEGERYQRECVLHEHAAALQRRPGPGTTWYADPSSPAQRTEMNRAGFTVLKGNNAIAAGLAAVRARVETGRLKVVRHACPNLMAEAQVYRYRDGRPGEEPLDEGNHAFDALRYLVTRIDVGFVSRYLRKAPRGQPADLGDEHPTSAARRAEQAAEEAAALHGAVVRAPRQLPSPFTDPDAWTSLN